MDGMGGVGVGGESDEDGGMLRAVDYLARVHSLTEALRTS